MFATADLYDAYEEALQVMQPGFLSFGRKTHFHGPVATVQALEDNTHVKSVLSTDGEGRVLVVDGGGSLRCALVGDNIAQLAIENGWAGVVVFGCIRDAAVIDQMDIGIRALGTNPRKSVKRDGGVTDITLRIAGCVVEPGMYLYSDADGIVLSTTALRPA